MLRQMMLSFLLGHLIVIIVFRIKEINFIEAVIFTKNLLLAFGLWLESFYLDFFNGFVE
jgi:hypothetical protein